jgi:hypothetical protein
MIARTRLGEMPKARSSADIEEPSAAAHRINDFLNRAGDGTYFTPNRSCNLGVLAVHHPQNFERALAVKPARARVAPFGLIETLLEDLHQVGIITADMRRKASGCNTMIAS